MSKVLIIIPIRPGLNETIRAMALAAAFDMMGANPSHELSYLIDNQLEPKQPGDGPVWAKVARVRNRILASINLSAYDYLLWIDADIIAYPPDMPTKLIAANPDGMTAPMVLVENSTRFYDCAGFIQKGRSHIEPNNPRFLRGRNLMHDPPYWFPAPPVDEVVEMDCVGAVTCIPTEMYLQTIGPKDILVAPYDEHEPSFTDHWPLAQRVRNRGQRVRVHRGVTAFHANLSQYPGEGWH